VDMDISMDIHGKSVDMDMDIDGEFHIYGKPGYKLSQQGLGRSPTRNHIWCILALKDETWLQ